jgi:hypothetical protein
MLTHNQVRVLTAARRRIEDRRNDYLCVAIREAAGDIGPEMHEASKDLRNYIANAMRTNGKWIAMLSTWQERNGFAGRNYEQRRKDRLAWIDWLLDDWIEHDGGPEPENVSRIRFRNLCEYEAGSSGGLRWTHTPPGKPGHCVDVVAYRVEKHAE